MLDNVWIHPSQSARRPRTLSGRPTLGPYDFFPDVLIRRGRTKGRCIDVTSDSDVRIAFYRRRDIKGCPENFHRAQSRSSSQCHVRMRRTMNDPCRVGFFSRFRWRRSWPTCIWPCNSAATHSSELQSKVFISFFTLKKNVLEKKLRCDHVKMSNFHFHLFPYRIWGH